MVDNEPREGVKDVMIRYLSSLNIVVEDESQDRTSDPNEEEETTRISIATIVMNRSEILERGKWFMAHMARHQGARDSEIMDCSGYVKYSLGKTNITQEPKNFRQDSLFVISHSSQIVEKPITNGSSFHK